MFGGGHLQLHLVRCFNINLVGGDGWFYRKSLFKSSLGVLVSLNFQVGKLIHPKSMCYSEFSSKLIHPKSMLF